MRNLTPFERSPARRLHIGLETNSEICSQTFLRLKGMTELQRQVWRRMMMRDSYDSSGK